jgi:hypothetical protein
MPLYPVAPVLGIVLNLVLGVFISWQTWAMGLAWLLLGVATYYALERVKSRETGEEIDTAIPEPEDD